jgi:hypothetical protein
MQSKILRTIFFLLAAAYCFREPFGKFSQELATPTAVQYPKFSSKKL